MEIKTEPLENCEVRLTVELDRDQTDKLLKKAARRLSRRVQIPGFRPGKAPFDAVVRRVGLEVIQEEALEDLDPLLKNALKETEIAPYGPGDLEEVEWEPLKISLRVPTQPEVDLGSYRDLRLESPAVEVSEEDVELALKEIQDSQTEWKPVERPAQIGDRVTCQLEGYVDGELEIEDPEATFLLIEKDTESHILGISQNVAGMTTGQDKEFTIQYPDSPDYWELAGKEVQMHLKLNLVEEGTVPPLDDDLAGLVGDFDTLDNLRDSLRQRLLEESKNRADQRLAEEALKKVIEGATKISYPSVMLEEEIDSILKEHDQRLRRDDFSLEAWLKVEGKTEEDFRKEMQPVGERRLRRTLVIGELARQEKLMVKTEEMAQRISSLIISAGEQAKEMEGALTSPDGLQFVAGSLQVEKVKDRLVAIVKGEAPSLEEIAKDDELSRLDELEETAGAEEMEELDSLDEEKEEKAEG